MSSLGFKKADRSQEISHWAMRWSLRRRLLRRGSIVGGVVLVLWSFGMMVMRGIEERMEGFVFEELTFDRKGGFSLEGVQASVYSYGGVSRVGEGEMDFVSGGVKERQVRFENLMFTTARDGVGEYTLRGSGIEIDIGKEVGFIEDFVEVEDHVREVSVRAEELGVSFLESRVILEGKMEGVYRQRVRGRLRYLEIDVVSWEVLARHGVEVRVDAD